jgi:hypothetical protein
MNRRYRLKMPFGLLMLPVTGRQSHETLANPKFAALG